MRTAPEMIAPGVLALLLATLLVACNKPAASPGASAAASAAPIAEAPTTPPDGEVCALLSDAEVRAVFPSAGAGKAENTRAKYGIKACTWDGTFGRFAVQLMPADQVDANRTMRSMADGFIDPLRADAKQHVRFEPLQGLGADATAVLEPMDAAKGITTEVAMLAAVKGQTTLMILSDGLAGGDRTQGLATLQALGQKAYARL
ncbi:hypothetical protein [Pseudoxanthomonas sp. GM95]|uniref:hypothetical protein n=1 Tax=Pseudoxanthomonas sp. GM95 TaxID=1881043 RepID=UPI00111415BF|nr:hypothetical protein [Pseudoxanthomonas sp. GM95]